MKRTILITGASSGLGEGMAREFAARGDNLALCARRTERLEALREELAGKYPQITISIRALDVNNQDRKSTRLNSSHVRNSYAVYCLKKKKMALLCYVAE